MCSSFAVQDMWCEHGEQRCRYVLGSTAPWQWRRQHRQLPNRGRIPPPHRVVKRPKGLRKKTWACWKIWHHSQWNSRCVENQLRHLDRQILQFRRRSTAGTTKTTTGKYHNNNDRARLDTTNNKRELKNELKNDILAPVTGSNVGWVDWGASPGEVWAKEWVKGAMADSADAVRRKRGTPERQKIVWNPKDEALFSVSCAVYI